MARYIERAENVARFIGVNLHLQLDVPLAPVYQWEPLIHTSGDLTAFRKQHTSASEFNVVQFLTFDTDNPNSIYRCLKAARENARSVRDTISSEMWEQINSMFLRFEMQRTAGLFESLPELTKEIRLACHLYQGIADATMSHNEAWHFLRLGRLMERSDKTSRILDVKYFILLPSDSSVGTPYDDLHWAAVLKSVSGFEFYRKKHGRISPLEIVEFLLMDLEFPRAIRRCLRGARNSLYTITGTPSGEARYESERLISALDDELDAIDVAVVVRNGLHEYLDRLQSRINSIDDAIFRDFFAWRPVDQPQAARATH
jgi:uncharacterized alpha-E superfamily protein